MPAGAEKGYTATQTAGGLRVHMIAGAKAEKPLTQFLRADWNRLVCIVHHKSASQVWLAARRQSSAYQAIDDTAGKSRGCRLFYGGGGRDGGDSYRDGGAGDGNQGCR